MGGGVGEAEVAEDPDKPGSGEERRSEPSGLEPQRHQPAKEPEKRRSSRSKPEPEPRRVDAGQPRTPAGDGAEPPKRRRLGARE